MLKKDRWGNDRPADSKGRYTKYIFGEPYNDYFIRLKSYRDRNKKSFIEKQAIRDKDLNIRLEKHDQVLIEKLSHIIKSMNPYTYVSINKTIVNNDGHQVTEIDIETKKYVIEVKSSKCKHHIKQFLTQKDYSKTFNKQYIIFAPKISIGVEKECKRNGLIVVKDINTFKKIYGGK